MTRMRIPLIQSLGTATHEEYEPKAIFQKEI